MNCGNKNYYIHHSLPYMNLRYTTKETFNKHMKFNALMPIDISLSAGICLSKSSNKFSLNEVKGIVMITRIHINLWLAFVNTSVILSAESVMQ